MQAQESALLCKNIFCIGRDEEEPLVSRAIKHSDLQLTSDMEILQSWDRMAARQDTVTKKAWGDWQQASGISFSPNALLMSAKIKRHGPFEACQFLLSRLDTCNVLQWYHGLNALFDNQCLESSWIWWNLGSFAWVCSIVGNARFLEASQCQACVYKQKS